MANLFIVAQTEAISQAAKMLFGFQPSINYTENQAIIRFTPEQNKYIANYFNSMMMDPTPPPIDIDFPAFMGPWVLKSALPYFLGAVLGGGAIGYLIKK